MGIPVVKSIYGHLPVYDSDTWEYQDLLSAVSGDRRRRRQQSARLAYVPFAARSAFARFRARMKQNILGQRAPRL